VHQMKVFRVALPLLSMVEVGAWASQLLMLLSLLLLVEMGA